MTETTKTYLWYCHDDGGPVTRIFPARDLDDACERLEIQEWLDEASDEFDLPDTMEPKQVECFLVGQGWSCVYVLDGDEGGIWERSDAGQTATAVAMHDQLMRQRTR